MEGHKELLDLWLAKTKGATFWLSVPTELQNRGLEDILNACVDGLEGFPSAPWPPPQPQGSTVYRPHGAQLVALCLLERLLAVMAELKQISSCDGK